MNFCVLGLGTSVPPHTMSQDEALALAKAVLKPEAAKARLLDAVYRRAGVKMRHTCIPYQTARISEGVDLADQSQHADRPGHARGPRDPALLLQRFQMAHHAVGRSDLKLLADVTDGRRITQSRYSD
jgi:hypothetical protein